MTNSAKGLLKRFVKYQYCTFTIVIYFHFHRRLPRTVKQFSSNNCNNNKHLCCSNCCSSKYKLAIQVRCRGRIHSFNNKCYSSYNSKCKQCRTRLRSIRIIQEMQINTIRRTLPQLLREVWLKVWTCEHSLSLYIAFFIISDR